MARLPGEIHYPTDEATWDSDWREFEGAMQAHADAEPRSAPQVNGFVGPATPQPAPVQPASEPAQEPDQVLAGWEALRAKRQGSDEDAVRQRWSSGTQLAEPNVGTSSFARELEEEGLFDRLAGEHAAERKREQRRAYEESADQTGIPASLRDYAERLGVRDPERRLGEADSTTRRFLSEMPGNAYVIGTQVPGGAISMAGTALQGAAVANPAEAIAANVQQYIPDLMRVPAMTAQELAEFRRRVDRETPATRAAVQSAISDILEGSARPQDMPARFAPPTPVEQRSLYRTGEAIQEYGRTFVPLPEGYTEESVSTQLGRGLGSMIAGLPVAWFLGPVGSGAFFGASGMGEATQNAVRFDQAERAAGRPGLTQEQITFAGILGVGPGLTDLVPVEVMLHQLRVPGMTPQASHALVRAIAGVGARVVFQSLIEGSQEAFQQVLQNVIAWSVYSPNQAMTQDVWWNGIIGGGVGAIAQGGQEAARGLLAIGGRRAGRSGRAAPPGAPPAPDTLDTNSWPEAQRRAASAPGALLNEAMTEGLLRQPTPAAAEPNVREARVRTPSVAPAPAQPQVLGSWLVIGRPA